MYTNYLIFYDNLLWYELNTDSEKLYISREPTVATFTQLKPIPSSKSKSNKLKVYIFLKYC